MTTQYNIAYKNIHICTHNVQGLNDKLKLQIWLEFCHESQFHIISMTETKIAKSTFSTLSLNNPYYCIFTANSNEKIIKKQEASIGTAIAVTKLLQPYIHNIINYPGTAIAIDFFFP